MPAILATLRVQLRCFACQAHRWLVGGMGAVLVGERLLAQVCAGFRFRLLRNFETMSMAAECATLHPMLCLMLWLFAIGDRRMVLADIAREPTGMP